MEEWDFGGFEGFDVGFGVWVFGGEGYCVVVCCANQGCAAMVG
jgi:hypothetical protein